MRRIDWLPPAIAAAALTVVGAVEVVLDPQFRQAPLAPLVLLAVVVAGTLLSAWAPVWGTAVAAAQFPLAAALGLNGPTGAGVLAFLLLPGWAGWRRPARISWLAPLSAQLLATVGAAAGSALEASVTGPGAAPDLASIVWENVYFSALAWVSWMVGAVARGAGDRAVRAEQVAQALDAERDARERAILVEERQRIARDLHDSVAHSVSVMTLQVGALRATLPEGSPEVELLRGIERLGRESVAELRSAVGILRRTEPEEVSPPSLDRAAELADELRAAGLDVTLVDEGEPFALPRAIDVSAFRVLQESLSNVMHHAPGLPAEVRIGRLPDRLTLEIENACGAATTGPRGDGGHGLVGMRERLAMVGGTFEAGPIEGRWRTRAEFPLEAGLQGGAGSRVGSEVER